MPSMLANLGLVSICLALNYVITESSNGVPSADRGVGAAILFMGGVALVMLHAWIAEDPDRRRPRAREAALEAAGAVLAPLLLDLTRGLGRAAPDV